jgi:hypothetical protein
MKPAVATVFLALAAAGFAGLLYRQSQLAEAREAALKTELTRLRQRVDGLDSQQHSTMNQALLSGLVRSGPVETMPPPIAHASAAAPSANALPSPEALEARRAASAERRAKRARAFDDYLVMDGLDKAWSETMVAAVYRAVDALHAARLVKTDCASHLCRVVVDHADVEQQRSFANEVWQAPPFDNGIFFQYDKSGPRPQTTLYVAREGTELSTLAR